MKYYLIAGEASGDLHGAGLIRELHRQDADAHIRCWGGDKMEAAGATLVKHYRDLAFMGFVEVVRHLPTILRNLSFCKKDILAYQPDVLVLVDYPGFNLRIAAWAKAKGIRVVYYISPQVWAWKEGRVKQIRRVVDRMLVILPFEVDFYKKWNYEVSYVGHPLAEAIAAARATPLSEDPDHRPILALLPGSRRMEIAKKLPVMLAAARQFPEMRIVVAGAPSLPESVYQPYLAGSRTELWEDRTYELLRRAHAALVTSGTATLETALFQVPQIVCYRGNPISYWLAKRLIRVPYISLVNLILNKPAVPELIQAALTPEHVAQTLGPLLGGPAREAMLEDYRKLELLLQGGQASQTAAALIVEEAQENKGGGPL